MLQHGRIFIASRRHDDQPFRLFTSIVQPITKTTMKSFSLSRYFLFVIAFVLTLCCCLTSCSTTQSIRGAALTNGNERIFNREMTIVLPALRQALTEERVTVTLDSAVDEKTHILIGETPISGFSWGEIIRVVAVKHSDNKTILRVLTERKLATNILANGDYSTNLFFNIEQTLSK